MRLLDLFCGAGGAAMGYSRAGFTDIVGVDIKPQPRYPFTFVEADAMTYPLDGFDAIHASPPCQIYSSLNTMRNFRAGHLDLVGPVRERLSAAGVPWIIENVVGAPLITPLILCGSQFGLKSKSGYELRRHRCFETSFALLAPGPCRHGTMTAGVYGSKVRDIAKEKCHYARLHSERGKPVGIVLPQIIGQEVMDIGWMKAAELSQAIPPAYTEYIGRYLLEYLR